MIINASPSEIYQALTDVKKLAHWWTTETRGESAVGKKLEFRFYGKSVKEMVVTALKIDELVRWRATERSDPDWVGTEIEWKIIREGKTTYLHLRHSKWPEDAQYFPRTSMHWVLFMLSLKEFVETGKGRPHPYDMPVGL
jgi:uncharacterized protein YndB with AHSA1/START domain